MPRLARPRKAEAPRPKERPKTSGVEERTLPDGSWERVFHGESMKDSLCRGALKQTAERSLQQHLDGERVRIRHRNDATESLVERERAEAFEKKGELRAVNQIVERGFGPGRPGCDRCKAQGRKLRYVVGAGCVCEGCREAIMEERDGVARHSA